MNKDKNLANASDIFSKYGPKLDKTINKLKSKKAKLDMVNASKQTEIDDSTKNDLGKLQEDLSKRKAVLEEVTKEIDNGLALTKQAADAGLKLVQLIDDLLPDRNNT